LSALRDPEDNPPNEPPAPRDTDEADTERPPPSAIADEVLAALKPILKGISDRVDSLHALRIEDLERLKAIDTGVGAALTQLADLGGQVENLSAHHEAIIVRHERLMQTEQTLADALAKHAAEMAEFRKHVEQQASHEGEQHAALRQSVTDLEQRANSGGE